MGNEELKPGDVVQHKATGKLSVVVNIDSQRHAGEVEFRDEENNVRYYRPFEVIKLNEDQWKDRLNQKLGELPKSKPNKGTEEMTKKMGNGPMGTDGP